MFGRPKGDAASQAGLMADTFGFPQPDPYDGSLAWITGFFLLIFAVVGAISAISGSLQ